MTQSPGSGPAPRSLMRSLSATALSQGIFVLASGLTSLLTARLLGPHGRGAIVEITALSSFVMLVASVGTNYSGRVLLVAKQNPVALGDYLGLALVLTCVDASLMIGASSWILPSTGVSAPLSLVLAGLAYGSTAILGVFVRDALYGLGFAGKAAATEAAGGGVAQLLLVAVLALANVKRVDVYVYGLAAGTGLQIVFASRAMRHADLDIRPGFQVVEWVRLLRAGAPGVLFGIGNIAVLRLDRLLVGFFASASAVGIYSTAATVTELLWLLPMALGQILLHGVASESLDYGLVVRTRRRLLAITGALAILLFLFGPVLLRLAVGSAYRDAGRPLRILVIGALFLASYAIDSMVLVGQGHLSQVGRVALAGMLAAIVLDIVAIPIHGIVGAAVASDLCYAGMAIAARGLLRRGRISSVFRDGQPAQ